MAVVSVAKTKMMLKSDPSLTKKWAVWPINSRCSKRVCQLRLHRFPDFRSWNQLVYAPTSDGFIKNFISLEGRRRTIRSQVLFLHCNRSSFLWPLSRRDAPYSPGIWTKLYTDDFSETRKTKFSFIGPLSKFPAVSLWFITNRQA